MHRMVRYVFIFVFSLESCDYKVRIVITPNHKGACPLGLLPYFHQSKLVVLVCTQPFGKGCKLSWLCLCYSYLNSTLGEHEQVIKETRI